MVNARKKREQEQKNEAKETNTGVEGAERCRRPEPPEGGSEFAFPKGGDPIGCVGLSIESTAAAPEQSLISPTLPPHRTEFG